jgi:hypothetical protein
MFDSPDLPHNDMGGLGRKDSTSPRPRRGRGHRLGEVLIKPVRLVDKCVTGVLRMTVRDVPRPLGEDTGERKDIRRKGHVLRVNGVDRHHIDVRVPEASPWRPIRIRSRRRGWVQWPQGCIHPPLDLSVHQDVTQLGGILRGKRAHRHLSNAGAPGLSPRATRSRRSRRGRKYPPLLQNVLVTLEVKEPRIDGDEGSVEPAELRAQHFRGQWQGLKERGWQLGRSTPPQPPQMMR